MSTEQVTRSLKQIAKARQRRNKRKRLRQEIRRYKADKGCLRCGPFPTRLLQFHHLRDKVDTVCQLVSRGSVRRLRVEIQKCVVLCASCHKKLHAGEWSIGDEEDS